MSGGRDPEFHPPRAKRSGLKDCENQETKGSENWKRKGSSLVICST